MLIEQDLSEEEALREIANEIGHRKIDRVKRMIQLKPTTPRKGPDSEEKD